MLLGLLILFSVFVLWPIGAWLQGLLMGTRAEPWDASTGSADFDRLAKLDILIDGRLDGRFGDEW